MRASSLLEVALLLPAAFGAAVDRRSEWSKTPFDKRSRTPFDKRTTANPTGILEADVLAGVAAINQQLYQGIEQPAQWKKCNPSNIYVRKEWSAFTTSQKKEYIKAVQCMATKPSITPKDKCPGCVSRYDDFLGTHINQTFYVHNTGNFLAWHRYFTWAYEQTLRDECGYTGYQPYYNWPRWANDPLASPVLDGSDTSMSGNGVAGCTNQTFWGIPTQAAPTIEIPHGSGGGCVTSGPFKDWKVNLGPVFSDDTCTPANPYSNFSDPAQATLIGLGKNTRCMVRDVSAWTSSQWLNDQQVVFLLNSSDIQTFWSNIQGGVPAFQNNYMGVHTAGHFVVGGDPGSDFFTSPGDPYFYFHHGQIDRAWWTWQNLQPANRTDAIYGTTYIADTTAPATQLTDEMNLGYAFPKLPTMTIKDAMSTMGGPFCYTYI